MLAWLVYVRGSHIVFCTLLLLWCSSEPFTSSFQPFHLPESEAAEGGPPLSRHSRSFGFGVDQVGCNFLFVRYWHCYRCWYHCMDTELYAFQDLSPAGSVKFSHSSVCRAELFCGVSLVLLTPKHQGPFAAGGVQSLGSVCRAAMLRELAAQGVLMRLRQQTKVVIIPMSMCALLPAQKVCSAAGGAKSLGSVQSTVTLSQVSSQTRVLLSSLKTCNSGNVSAAACSTGPYSSRWRQVPRQVQ